MIRKMMTTLSMLGMACPNGSYTRRKNIMHIKATQCAFSNLLSFLLFFLKGPGGLGVKGGEWGCALLACFGKFDRNRQNS